MVIMMSEPGFGVAMLLLLLKLIMMVNGATLCDHDVSRRIDVYDCCCCCRPGGSGAAAASGFNVDNPRYSRGRVG